MPCEGVLEERNCAPSANTLVCEQFLYWSTWGSWDNENNINNEVCYTDRMHNVIKIAKFFFTCCTVSGNTCWDVTVTTTFVKARNATLLLLVIARNVK